MHLFNFLEGRVEIGVVVGMGRVGVLLGGRVRVGQVGVG